MKKRVRFKKILNLLFLLCRHGLLFLQNKNVRTKVRLGVKRKATHCLSKENTGINK